MPFVVCYYIYIIIQFSHSLTQYSHALTVAHDARADETIYALSFFQYSRTFVTGRFLTSPEVSTIPLPICDLFRSQFFSFSHIFFSQSQHNFRSQFRFQFVTYFALNCFKFGFNFETSFDTIKCKKCKIFLILLSAVFNFATFGIYQL